MSEPSTPRSIGPLELEDLDADGALREVSDALGRPTRGQLLEGRRSGRRGPAGRRGRPGGRCRGPGQRQAGPNDPQLRAGARVPPGRLLHRGGATGCAQGRVRPPGPGGGRARARAREGTAPDAGVGGHRPAEVRLPRSHGGPARVPQDGRGVRGSGHRRVQGPGAQDQVARLPGGRHPHPLGGGPPRRLDQAPGRRAARSRRLRRAAAKSRVLGVVADTKFVVSAPRTSAFGSPRYTG